jgi:hypothetical protein
VLLIDGISKSEEATLSQHKYNYEDKGLKSNIFSYCIQRYQAKSFIEEEHSVDFMTVKAVDFGGRRPAGARTVPVATRPVPASALSLGATR